MGTYTSKPQTNMDDEIAGAFADMFADAMERADWHGHRKPTWQQCRDMFVIRVKNAETVA
jgi:hypothetical protein